MKFAKIFLVRHGEIVNHKGIIYGYLPLPLSSRGEKQIKKAGSFLKKQKIAAIFASPMRRTQQTAKILKKAIGKIKIHTEEGLRESWTGALEGLTWADARKKYPKELYFYRHKPERLKKGESFEKIAKRVEKTVWGRIKKYPGKNLVFVSHGDPILCFLFRLSKKKFSELANFKQFCPMGAVLEVDLMGKKLINKTF
ncbi:MAG: histidine phosphatase family protein [Candidatus Portnoybacteria bacterium]|nr:histidine phosphatase family protein [Candidatus Portnoybacteria bacterium]